MGIFHSYVNVDQRVECLVISTDWSGRMIFTAKNNSRNMSPDMDVFSCYPPIGGCVQWPYGVKHTPKSHEKSVAGCDQSLWCGFLLREHEQPWRRIAILLDSRIWYMDIYIYIIIIYYIYYYILYIILYIYYITLYIVYIYIYIYYMCVCLI